jgi:hypothetical protein
MEEGRRTVEDGAVKAVDGGGEERECEDHVEFEHAWKEGEDELWLGGGTGETCLYSATKGLCG